ncbi:hypothetical protein SR80_03575 [Enterobacter hormaechei subsp. xiangfangensis]|uniref:Uncharacterized protein n=7 Tax=Enterobacteriaceae TaxID=543 RepID=A0A3T0VBQ9_ECOLX|nr:hypothetical protein ECL_04902 [Enterobacter cloacae subsp. cloacae ATCC 13047]AFG20564.1 hypothetical protein pSH111_227_123 [Salmonella enterica subsp. enterica serovar Heidelberg]AIX52994.1 hypothetical protein ECNIH4_01530 [Enterobacter cloacae]AJB64876.1 hypothetical protein LI62_23565 [Enterobacter hormaechei subsp. steigerwaltii]AJB72816.1 hypothetical protein LI64_20650 [Enterobacter hormaechei subsp. hormaechei]AJB83811.1 hypothetical protein LI66_21545 [Enterobacter hormaechei sub
MCKKAFCCNLNTKYIFKCLPTSRDNRYSEYLNDISGL